MFDEINSVVLRHPEMLVTLRIFFYLKLWSLTGIAMFFLYLIHREQGKKVTKRNPGKGLNIFFFLA